jgi:hypothetical protein
VLLDAGLAVQAHPVAPLEVDEQQPHVGFASTFPIDRYIPLPS